MWKNLSTIKIKWTKEKYNKNNVAEKTKYTRNNMKERKVTIKIMKEKYNRNKIKERKVQ